MAQSDTGIETKDTRERKMTMKGSEYTLETKRKRMDHLCNALNKRGDEITELLTTEAEDREVTKSYKKWISLYDEFLTVERSYRDLLPERDRDNYDESWFLPRNKKFIEFKESAEEWFAHNARAKSVKSESACSKSSRHSSRSSHHSRSSQQEKERKRAEIESKLELLEKKRVIEEAKLRLKLQEEELLLQEELKANAAERDLLDDLDSRSNRSHSTQSDQSALMSIVKHLRKPSTEIKKFGGNPMEFQRFKRQFKTRIISNCSDADEQLNYLEQYTTGEANKIVIGYSYMDATKGFKAAMKELEERYGDADVIVHAFVKRALTWPTINADNPKTLDEFAIFLAECERAVSDLESLRILEYSENFKKIVGKLPYGLHDRWRTIVSQKKEKGERIKFSHLVEYVRKEAKKANDPVFGRTALKAEPQQSKSSKQQPKKAQGSFAAKVNEVKEDAKPAISSTQDIKPAANKPHAFTSPCLHCKGSHALQNCNVISAMPYNDRIDALRVLSTCFGCLRFGHSRQNCRNKATCKACQGRHPSILHVEGRPPPRRDSQAKPDEEEEKPSQQKVSSALTADSHQEGNPSENEAECTMAIIPVKVKLSGSNTPISTYAFMDSGSNISFCAESLMHQLGSNGKRKKLSMDTMGPQVTVSTYELRGLEIMDLNETNRVPLPLVYTKERMPVTREHIPTTEDIQKWPHLRDVNLPQINADIGLVIGNNIPDAWAPLDVRVGPRGSPHATRSLLGWIPWNVLRPGCDKPATAGCVNQAIKQLQEIHELNDLYLQSLNIDFPERRIDDRKEPSLEDKRFIEKVSSSKRLVDSHYELCLPFREVNPSLPDNEYLAKQRLKGTEKKLSSNIQFYNDYVRFMETLSENGYSEIVPKSEIDRSDGMVWYLPHHGVYHPNKPQKIRVVFDCSAKFQGVALNDVLLQGPDLTNSLSGVLLKFRQDRVATIGDVEKMFYQVKVPVEDRDCLRYFWWEGGDLTKRPIIYRMTVHLFGAASSPSCASFALRQTIEDNRDTIQEPVAKAALSNFYVDDFLCSFSTESQAIDMISNLTSVCKLGGFRVTKWISNSRQVLESVPESERGTDISNLDFENYPSERALGVIWNIESDTIGIKVNMKPRNSTRKSVLSVTSSVYDPLGIVAPFILIARRILQSLCRKSVKWEDQIPEEEQKLWNDWLMELPELNKLQIPRCLKPENHQNISRVELHHFADASEAGYGTATYVRFESDSGQTHCTLLLGKSRVAPIKKITIPRMELAAATLSVKLNKVVTSDLDYTIDEVYYWTDSMAVLRCIHNKTKRFQTYVANRLNIIHEGSRQDQWRFVESQSNPADYASRGLRIHETAKIKTWLEGPEYLRKPQSEWPKGPDESDLELTDDLEVKTSTCAVTVKDANILDDIVQHYNDWKKIQRIYGWVLLYIKCLKKRVQNRSSKQSVKKTESNNYKILPTEVLKEAETKLIKHVQQLHFSREISDLKDGNHVNKSSSISKLDPYLLDGIVRVGGRTDKSTLSLNAKHQILLPKESLLAERILRHTHKSVGHLGKNATLAKLRERYWVPKAGSFIKRLLLKCVVCRKYQARKLEQKMAELPAERLAGGEPPFSNVGMDYFGPIEIKRCRTILKRYGVIFTCSTSRAVHLEMAHSLTTDSCLNAIRRFLSRRGPVLLIRSDNGTNLVGAKSELTKEIKNWNQSSIGSYLQQQDIRWEFNPPAGSHFGGFWERLIRLVRKVMYSILKSQTVHMDDEGLQTLLCEVEGILNGRPITPASDDPQDLDALTPNHLLQMKSSNSLPPGVFDETDHYVRKRWRQVQQVTNTFWTRWKREYLPLLQTRQKWTRSVKNLAVGDIVLLTDNTPRNVWPLGRVVATHADRKGQVRVVDVQTKASVLQRPIDKLCLVLEGETSAAEND